MLLEAQPGPGRRDKLCLEVFEGERRNEWSRAVEQETFLVQAVREALLERRRALREGMESV